MCKYVGLLFVLLHAQLPRADSDSPPQDNSGAMLNGIDDASPHRGRRKCCQPHKAYFNGSLQCVELHDDTISRNYSQFDVVQHLSCSVNKEFLMMALNENFVYQLLENGTIEDLTYNTSYNYDDYCFEYFIEDRKFMPVICVNVTDADTDADANAKTEYPPPQSVAQIVAQYHWCGLATSNLFLIVTLALYLGTPKLRRKMHDKCFLCHVATLIVGFSSLIGIQCIGPPNDYCIFLAYMTQFWLLSSFCWLNVMCIHTWRSLFAVKSRVYSSTCTLIIYCLYGWGCPLLVSAVTLGAQFFLSKDNPLNPNIGDNSCWFKTYTGDFWLDPNFLYFYGFISITLLSNLYVFVNAAFLLFARDKRWQSRENQDSRRHGGQKIRFFRYLNLFLLMGLNWIMEVTSYYTKGEDGLWIVIDFVTTLQGVFIFVIFVCNKRVRVLLKNNFIHSKLHSDRINNKRVFGTRTFQFSLSLR